VNLVAKIKQEIRRHADKGFVHLMTSSVVCRVLEFGFYVIIARLMAEDDVGLWFLLENILRIALLTEGLGLIPGLVQFASSEPKNSVGYLRFVARIGLAWSLALAGGVLAYSFAPWLPAGAGAELRLLALLPIVAYAFKASIGWMRVKQQFQRTGLVNFLHSAIMTLGALTIAAPMGVTGLIITVYLAKLIPLAIYAPKIWATMNEPVGPLARDSIRALLKYSLAAMVANSLSMLLFLADVFLLGVILESLDVIADFRLAMMIPFGFLFLGQSFAGYMLPQWSERWQDLAYLRRSYRRCLGILTACYGGLLIVMVTLGGTIINVAFGERYSGGVEIFQWAALGVFLAGSFRVTSGNFLAAIRKTHINMINALFYGTANIVLNLLLIPRFGSLGAVWTTVCVIALSAACNNILIARYLRPEKASNSKPTP